VATTQLHIVAGQRCCAAQALSGSARLALLPFSTALHCQCSAAGPGPGRCTTSTCMMLLAHGPATTVLHAWRPLAEEETAGCVDTTMSRPVRIPSREFLDGQRAQKQQAPRHSCTSASWLLLVHVLMSHHCLLAPGAWHLNSGALLQLQLPQLHLLTTTPQKNTHTAPRSNSHAWHCQQLTNTAHQAKALMHHVASVIELELADAAPHTCYSSTCPAR
jgi:hypothetical protein